MCVARPCFCKCVRAPPAPTHSSRAKVCRPLSVHQQVRRKIHMRDVVLTFQALMLFFLQRRRIENDRSKTFVKVSYATEFSEDASLSHIQV